MIQWSKKIYVHPDIKEDMDSIIDRINSKRYSLSIYCIIRSLDDKNLFEIICSEELSNILYKDKNIQIIGIAQGKRQCEEVLVDIIEAIVDEQGNINLNML